MTVLHVATVIMAGAVVRRGLLVVAAHWCER